MILDGIGDEGPELVDVDGRAVELVAEAMKITHADLAEVARMVLIEEDAVMVHASSVTTAAGMLAVLADAAVPGTDVTALLAVFFETGSHVGGGRGRAWGGLGLGLGLGKGNEKKK